MPVNIRDNGKQDKGIKPRYDYDSEEFYNAIASLAQNGAKDSEIALALKSKIKLIISPQTFAAMKNGCYSAWTDEENKVRGERMRKTLESARSDITRLVRAVYLQVALGKGTNKTTTTVRRRLRIDGQLTENEEIQTTETVSGIAPNMQALSQWLYHHDCEWRKIQKGEEIGGDDAPTPDQVVKGVDINAWLDKEMTEFGTSATEEVEESGIGDVTEEELNNQEE